MGNDVLQAAFTEIWDRKNELPSSPEKQIFWMLPIARKYALSFESININNDAIHSRFVNVNVMRNFVPGSATVVGELTDVLTEEEQVVFSLIYFYGYTLAEVANALDISIGMAGKTIRKAMNHLKNNIPNV